MRHNSNRFSATISTMMLLVVFTFLTTITARAAAPVGQTIWIRAAATNLLVSADQNRGAWALVADRTSVQVDWVRGWGT